MKNLFKNITVFVVLGFVLSGFVACTKTTSPSNGTADSATISNANSAANATTAKGGSEFPPAPSAIMQAEIKDVDGNTFKLEDKKGKVVLVNLWGIWCGPCVAEMPELVALQEKYKDKDFEILGLNIGDEDGGIEPAENIKAFAAKKSLNYQLGYSDSKFTTEIFKISRRDGVPQSILINRDGRLTGVFFGGGPNVIGQVKETVEKTVNE